MKTAKIIKINNSCFGNAKGMNVKLKIRINLLFDKVSNGFVFSRFSGSLTTMNNKNEMQDQKKKKKKRNSLTTFHMDFDEKRHVMTCASNR